MSEKTEREVGWEPCPKGEIGRMLDVIQRNRRRAAVVQTAVAVAGAVLIATIVVRSVPAYRSAPRTDEMTCADVLACAPAYLSGRLAPQLRAKVEEHLRKCPGCREKLQPMKASHTSQRTGARSTAPPHVVYTGTRPAVGNRDEPAAG